MGGGALRTWFANCNYHMKSRAIECWMRFPAYRQGNSPYWSRSPQVYLTSSASCNASCTIVTQYNTHKPPDKWWRETEAITLHAREHASWLLQSAYAGWLSSCKTTESMHNYLSSYIQTDPAHALGVQLRYARLLAQLVHTGHFSSSVIGG
jgi:hypothetical protein